jgi:hypothetical protein
MKLRVTILLAIILVLAGSMPCWASTGDTYVWVSEDLDGAYNKIGYFQMEERFTKIVASDSTTLNYFDMSFGYKIISFENAGGLYGELGVDSTNGKLNLLFGAGFIYESPASTFLILVGPKYYVQDQKLNTEGQIFIKIINPVIVNAGYDTNSNSVYVGVGLKFR